MTNGWMPSIATITTNSADVCVYCVSPAQEEGIKENKSILSLSLSLSHSHSLYFNLIKTKESFPKDPQNYFANRNKVCWTIPAP